MPMRYRQLSIQTQREFPNNARTPGFGWLVRAGYISREQVLLPLGEQAIARLRQMAAKPSFFHRLALPVLSHGEETYFPFSDGALEIMYCPVCGSVSRREIAKAHKTPFSDETPLPIEKVSTPECNTIESLASFLNIPKEKTAKALMFTRLEDGQFVFVVVRGDMTLSEAKLKSVVGDFRLATPEEILRAGAVPGYASPVGLQKALIVVDDLIPRSPNLVAGANEAGYHLRNVNCGRDYLPHLVADLTLAQAGDRCPRCQTGLSLLPAELLATRNDFFFEKILRALAETHHDDRGLTFPPSAAPFDVYLMHIPGRELDTAAIAQDVFIRLENAGLTVLFDDRDERAGVKFNDADLIGCPLRVTVGEKNLKEGQVELKWRKSGEQNLVSLEDLSEFIRKRFTEIPSK
ncbi:MAG: proline--tRNA ligase [Anaerolineae bacterium]